MAVIRNNMVMEGVSGMVGDVVVFKQWNGKTIVANRPSKPRTQSELQRKNRMRFKEASAYAKGILLNAERKEYYTRKAKKLKLPNAYTAAIADYMRKATVENIDTRKFNTTTGGEIKIQAYKKGFTPHIQVALCDSVGRVIERGEAVLKNYDYYYTAKAERYDDLVSLRIMDFRVEIWQGAI